MPRFEVQSAGTLSEALRLLGETVFDAAVLDLGLPDSSGTLTVEAVRKRFPQLAIVVFSGACDEATVHEAMGKGAEDYILKSSPILELLPRSVLLAVERKRSENAIARTASEWQATFDSSNDAIWLIDKDQRVLRANKMAEKMFPLPSGSAIGRFCYEIVHGTTEPISGCPVERTRTSLQRETIELQIGERFYQVTGDPILDQSGQYSGAVHIIRDITGHKVAERALLANETRFKELFENMSSGVAVYEARDNGNDFVFQAFNTAAEKIDGQRREELLGKSVLAMRPNIKDFGLFDVFQRVYRTGTPEHHPVSLYKDSRLSGWYENYIFRIPTGEIIAVFDNITARMQAEEELQESEIRYRRLFESAKDGILILDADTGMIMDVNPFLIELLGFSLEAFLGRKVWELGVLKDVPANQEKFEELQKNKYVRYENLPLETSEGRQIQVEFVSNVYLVNGTKVIQCNIRDVTERVRLEKEMRRAHEHLLLAQKAAHAGFWNWDMASGKLDWTPELFELFGLDPSHGQATFDTWRRVIHPEDRERAEKNVTAAVQEHRRLEQEYRVVLPSKEVRWIRAIGDTMYDEAGRPFHMSGICLDSTAQRHAEDTLKRNLSILNETGRMAKVGGWELDIETGIPTWTDETFHIFEIDRTNSEPLLPEGLSCYASDSRPIIAGAVQRCIENGEPYEVEVELITKKGNHRWVRTSGKPNYINGKIKSISGTIQDITESKLAENVLQLQNKFNILRIGVWKLAANKNAGRTEIVQNLLELVGPALGVSRACFNEFEHGDPEHDDIVCTQEWCATGVTPSLGSRLPATITRHLIHPEGALLDSESALARAPALVRPLLKPVIEVYQRVYNIESVFVLPFPLEGPLEGLFTFDICRNQPAKVAFLKEERAVLREMAAIVTSHISHQRYEEALRDSKEKFKYIFEHSMLGKSITFMSGEISVNRTLCEMLGYSKDELSRKKWQDITHPDDIKASQEEMDRITAGEKESARLTKRYIRKDGSIMWADISSALRRDKTGKPLYFITTIDDITDNKKSEDMLKERDILFSRLSAHVPGMIYQFKKRTDGTYCVPFTTEAIRDCFGCSPEDVKDDFSPIAKAILPEDLKKVADSIEYSASHLTDFICEYRVQVKGGPVRWMLGHSTPTKLDDGSILWYGFNADITERKQAEEKILRNEARLKGLVDILQYRAGTTQEFLNNALNEAIKITDSRIGYIYLYNENGRQFILNSWSKDVMKDCAVTNPQTCYELDKTGIWGEAVRQRKPIIINDFQADHPLKKGYPKGHVHLSRFMTVPIFKNERIAAVAGVANKTTDYDDTDVLQLKLLMNSVWKWIDEKKSEEILRESEAKFRALAEYSVDTIMRFDRQHRHLYANPVVKKQTGIEPESFIGKTHREMGFPEDLCSAWDEAIAKVFKTGQTNRIEFMLPNGAWIDWLLAPELDEKGKVAGVVASARDISARKLAEKQLYETNTALQKSLEDLKLAQQKLIQQERLSALGQMASGIAHDFNNVLMPIIGFSDLLLSKPSILEDQKESLEMIRMIHTAGNDARQIVRRLRAVYRKGDQTDCSRLDIARIVESAISLTTPKWKEEMRAKNVAIDIKTDFHPVPLIRGNESDIRELLTNLIFNAVDAMPGGGVITFRVFLKNNISVVLEVADNGTGMDQETLLHCMEPFFTTKIIHGSGLGLPMTKAIVERHDGTFDIESSPGAGTTVRLTFPVPDKSEDKKKAPQKTTTQLPPLKILVIDDEERSRELVARILKHDSHHVVLAKDGREGLARFKDGKFNLVITDRAMPGLSGDEVALQISKSKSHVPVIMLTGFGDIMKDSGECPPGVTQVMCKPVTPDELRLAMTRATKTKAPRNRSKT